MLHGICLSLLDLRMRSSKPIQGASEPVCRVRHCFDSPHRPVTLLPLSFSDRTGHPHFLAHTARLGTDLPSGTSFSCLHVALSPKCFSRPVGSFHPELSYHPLSGSTVWQPVLSPPFVAEEPFQYWKRRRVLNPVKDTTFRNVFIHK